MQQHQRQQRRLNTAAKWIIEVGCHDPEQRHRGRALDEPRPHAGPRGAPALGRRPLAAEDLAHFAPGGAPIIAAVAMSADTSRWMVGYITISCSTVRAGMVAQNMMVRATSSACIMVARALASGGSGRLSRMGVSTSAGMIVMARMPLSRHVVWMLDMRLRTAALAAP